MNVFENDEFVSFLLNETNEYNNNKILILGGRINHKSLYSNDYCKKLNLEIKKLNPTKIICIGFYYAYLYYKFQILDIEQKIDYIYVYSPYFYIDEIFSNFNFVKKHNNYSLPNACILKKYLDVIYSINPKFNLIISHIRNILKNKIIIDFKLKNNLKKIINIDNLVDIGINFLKNLKKEVLFKILNKYILIKINNNNNNNNNNIYFLDNNVNKIVLVQGNSNININDYLNSNYEKKYNSTEGFFIIDYLVKQKIKVNLVGFSTFGGNENKNEEIKDYLKNMNISEKQDIESDILNKLVINGNINCLEYNLN